MLRTLLRLAIAASTIASIIGTPAAAVHAADEGVVMHHIPAWVQSVVGSGRLYAGDTGSKAIGDALPRYAYLRVLAGGDARLQVELTSDTGQAGARGWVDPDDVLPSASGQNWLVTSESATLFASADGASGKTLDRFTPLQQIDGPLQGRIQVRVYRADVSAVVDSGWVDQAQTGPAFAPATRVPDPNWGKATRQASSADQSAFLDSATQAATAASARTGVPASVTVAQAILESDWGRSLLAQSASNYFGVKAISGLGNDGVVWMSTGEYDDQGQAYETMSPFRAYRSLTDSLIDHDLMLRNGARYASAMQSASDPRQFAQLLSDAGYATDPSYADKLIALMDRYNLYRLDA